MFFGVINSSAIFQGYINSILQKYLDKLCIAYLDDIFVYFVDPTQYTNNDRAVLKLLLKYELFVNLEKCVLYVKRYHFWNSCLQMKE